MEDVAQTNEERREELFGQLENDTKLYSDGDYRRVYALHKEHWGIDSPACILYKNFFDNHPSPELIPSDIKGEMLIAINKDAVPDQDFIKYLRLHEYWEHYMRAKEGFNLMKSDEKDYSLPILERKRPSHRVAIFKELQAAKADNKLEEYMEWWRKFYKEDEDRINSLEDDEVERISLNYSPDGGGRETIVEFIRSNLQIRERVYKKLVQEKHSS